MQLPTSCFERIPHVRIRARIIETDCFVRQHHVLREMVLRTLLGVKLGVAVATQDLEIGV